MGAQLDNYLGTMANLKVYMKSEKYSIHVVKEPDEYGCSGCDFLSADCCGLPDDIADTMDCGGDSKLSIKEVVRKSKRGKTIKLRKKKDGS